MILTGLGIIQMCLSHFLILYVWFKTHIHAVTFIIIIPPFVSLIVWLLIKAHDSHDFLLIVILGKASILQQATNSAKRQIISQYILKK